MRKRGGKSIEEYPPHVQAKIRAALGVRESAGAEPGVHRGAKYSAKRTVGPMPMRCGAMTFASKKEAVFERYRKLTIEEV